jgi:hypothetical protein
MFVAYEEINRDDAMCGECLRAELAAIRERAAGLERAMREAIDRAGKLSDAYMDGLEWIPSEDIDSIKEILSAALAAPADAKGAGDGQG